MGRAMIGSAKIGSAKIGMLAREDPPPKAARGSIVAEVLALVPQLRGERGAWFRIAEFTSKSGAYSTGRALEKRYPHQIETSHERTDSGSVLYARWMGNRSNGAQP